MKLLLVVVGLVLAVSAEGRVWRDYHEEYGYAEAARRKHAELAMDFDGTRIVGGTFSRLGQLPHQAGLLVINARGSESVCGGVIVSNTRVLTCAHCWRFREGWGRSVTVVVGTLTIHSGGQRLVTTQVQAHEHYNLDTANNDIAMVFTGRINFNNNVNSINIATGNNLFVGAMATVSGWGQQGVGRPIPRDQRLKHVSQQVITNQACISSYNNRVVIPSVICTATTGGRGPCIGDSGGPLETGTGAGRILIGIVSFSHWAGCDAGHPAGYTRVTSFTNWIRQRM